MGYSDMSIDLRLRDKKDISMILDAIGEARSQVIYDADNDCGRWSESDCKELSMYLFRTYCEMFQV